MKLICTDRDNCGFYEKLINLEDDTYEPDTCPICGSIAITISNNYTPIFYQTDEEIETLIAGIYNLYSNIENQKEDP